MVATPSRVFNCFSASNVALITLCGFVVPIDFVSTFCTPTDVITARTAPPAITPVPSGAGFNSTFPDPYRPRIRCGIEVCVRFTLIRFFFADSIALRIACGTSLALPAPWPTTAADGSPTTTSAANERFLPPLTTLVTRLMATTWSFSWYEPASSFLIIVGILTLVSCIAYRLLTLPLGAGLRPRLHSRAGCGYVTFRTVSLLRGRRRQGPLPGRDKCSRL